MSEFIQSVVLLLYAGSFVSIWFYVSAAITVVHTVDEIVSDGGPIWDYLLGFGPAVFAPAYFVFQAGVVCLAWVAFGSGPAWPLIAIRIVDILVTHNLVALLFRGRPNPGRATSWLLALDVVVLSPCLFYGGLPCASSSF